VIVGYQEARQIRLRSFLHPSCLFGMYRVPSESEMLPGARQNTCGLLCPGSLLATDPSPGALSEADGSIQEQSRL
jgi:hypothetical protein